MRNICLAFALLALAACSPKGGTGSPAQKPAGAAPVTVGEVVQKDVPVTIEAIGNVEAFSTVAIKAQVGGELIDVHFQEGQEVKKGDALFTIQPLLYETQLKQAQAQLDRDRAQATISKTELDRALQLAQKGAGSKEELDKARASADQAAATVVSDEGAVKIAGVRLGYCFIKSPIDGRTGSLMVYRGNLVKENADTPMVTITQIVPINVSFSVPEQNLAEIKNQIAAGGKLNVTAGAKSAPLRVADGELTFIDNAVDQTTGTIRLKGTFPNEDKTLWPGQFVNATLALRVEKNATVVPGPAIQTGQKGQYVYVLKSDATVEMRPVAVARTLNERETVVTDGVKPGEKVITDGQVRLIPGAKVEVKNAPVAVAP